MWEMLIVGLGLLLCFIARVIARSSDELSDWQVVSFAIFFVGIVLMLIATTVWCMGRC